ncbi:MAG: ATP12 family protein [Methylovirgula sp.]|uniref:ATP12 family chaperone protein n=1 Tax=Methylovirgula sp. TaxID=1978224 RepID=UPI00307600E7
MRDDLTKPQPQPADPVALARRELQKALPGRFYKDVRAKPLGDGFALALDGRIAKTPAKHDLVVPTPALADAIVGEWQAQGEKIDFAAMPLTRLAFTAIDGIAGKVQAVTEDIVKYSETDLVCYRAAEPTSLVAAQAAAWDPILDFAATQLDARFVCAEGVMFVSQPEAARAAIAARVAEIGGGMNAPFALASLSTMTVLTGSILIALALTGGELSLFSAWAAAHVDEDFQARQWGQDREATARRNLRFADMAAAEKFWLLLHRPEKRPEEQYNP